MGVDRKAIKPDRKLLIIIQSNGVKRKIICMRENAQSNQNQSNRYRYDDKIFDISFTNYVSSK